MAAEALRAEGDACGLTEAGHLDEARAHLEILGRRAPQRRLGFVPVEQVALHVRAEVG